MATEHSHTRVPVPTEPGPPHAAGSPRIGSAEREAVAPRGTDLLAAFERIERLLREIHANSEAAARRDRHKEFSPAWLIGGVVQVLTLGLIIAAAADWAYQAGVGMTLVKLAFAGVLQLGALTAFVLARSPNGLR